MPRYRSEAIGRAFDLTPRGSSVLWRTNFCHRNPGCLLDEICTSLRPAGFAPSNHGAFRVPRL